MDGRREYEYAFKYIPNTVGNRKTAKIGDGRAESKEKHTSTNSATHHIF